MGTARFSAAFDALRDDALEGFLLEYESDVCDEDIGVKGIDFGNNFLLSD